VGVPDSAGPCLRDGLGEEGGGIPGELVAEVPLREGDASSMAFGTGSADEFPESTGTRLRALGGGGGAPKTVLDLPRREGDACPVALVAGSDEEVSTSAGPSLRELVEGGDAPDLIGCVLVLREGDASPFTLGAGSLASSSLASPVG
jgi:hypothetical protein